MAGEVEHKSLRSLTKIEAVTDALYRAVVGLDSGDAELWASAWAKADDVSFELVEPLIGIEAINQNVFERIKKLETLHTTSNVRVDMADSSSLRITNDSKAAKLTCYAVNHHFRLGEGKDPVKRGYTGGAKYVMDLLEDKTDGLWKIHHWKMELIWAEGDSSVMEA